MVQFFSKTWNLFRAPEQCQPGKGFHAALAAGGCRRRPGAGSGERDPCFGQALPRGRKKAAPRRVRQAWPARDSFRQVLAAPGAFRAIRPRDTCLSAGCHWQSSAGGPARSIHCHASQLASWRDAFGSPSPLPCHGAGSGGATKAGCLRGSSAGSSTFFAQSLPECKATRRRYYWRQVQNTPLLTSLPGCVPLALSRPWTPGIVHPRSTPRHIPSCLGWGTGWRRPRPLRHLRQRSGSGRRGQGQTAMAEAPGQKAEGPAADQRPAPRPATRGRQAGPVTAPMRGHPAA